MYNRHNLFAVVSHRAWPILPGAAFAILTSHTPVAITIQILNKYRWSVLNEDEISCKFLTVQRNSICLNATIGSRSHPSSFLPIAPSYVFGPVVLPSCFLIKFLNGNSFKCNKQIIHCNGLFNFLFMWKIIPPFHPVF